MPSIAQIKGRARRLSIEKEAHHISLITEAASRYASRDNGASARELAARRSARAAAKLAAELERTYWQLVMVRLGRDPDDDR
jgi:hypothetical protein